MLGPNFTCFKEMPSNARRSILISKLASHPQPAKLPSLMKAFLAIFVWLLMAAILIFGVVMAVVKGSFIVLTVASVLFILAVAKIGCLSH